MATMWVDNVMGCDTGRNKNPDWGVEKLVVELRQLRLRSLESRHRQNYPPKHPLPSFHTPQGDETSLRNDLTRFRKAAHFHYASSAP